MVVQAAYMHFRTVSIRNKSGMTPSKPVSILLGHVTSGRAISMFVQSVDIHLELNKEWVR